METPISSTRITRSQTKAALLSSRKMEESEKCNNTKKSTQRSGLIDITNGSPIVGLANSAKLIMNNNNNNETPISSLSKYDNKSSRCNKTPGSGEALLRGQVHNLLHKVEQVSNISKFLSFDTVSSRSNGGVSKVQFDSLGSVLESPVEDKLTLSQKADSESKSENDVISRSLLQDFSEKSSSVMTVQGSEEAMQKGIQKKSSLEDDDEDDEDASIWSVQVNMSTRDEDEVEVLEDDISSQLDEVCEGLKNISMNEETTMMTGKHVRFVYDSEDELVEEEEVLHLKGLPTPKGKHLRFQDE